MHTKIRLPMAIIIGINAMVGAGIFTVPAALEVSAGPAGLLTYLFVIISVIFMALALAYVSELYPEAGAFYVYARAWAGHLGGLVASFVYICGLIVAMGLLTKITCSYIAIYISQYSPQLMGLLIILALMALNLAGAVLSQMGQVILFMLTLLPLCLITILCLTKASLAHLIPFAPYGFSKIFTAIKAVVFGFFGFEAIPSLFVLLDNPKKTIPRAIVISVMLTGIIYLVFVSSIFLALPRELFSNAGTPLAQVLLQEFPDYPILIDCINWSIIITIIGTLHAMMWAVSLLLFSVAHKTKILAHITQKSALALVAGSIVAASIFFKNIDLLFSIAALLIVAAYMSAMIPLITNPQGRSPARIAVAFCGLITAAIICICAMDGIFHFML